MYLQITFKLLFHMYIGGIMHLLLSEYLIKIKKALVKNKICGVQSSLFHLVYKNVKHVKQ